MSVQLTRLIKEICAGEGISFSAFSDGYILLLQKNGKKMYIYGNKFANNNASAERICDDKAGLSELLAANGIPCVPHRFFGSPAANWYSSAPEKDKAALLYMLNASPGGLVIKENSGSGGINVYKVTNEAQLLRAVEKVFNASPFLAAAPYVDIKHEYRVLMLGTEYRYAFEKIRRTVTGNGKNTVNELLTQRYGENAFLTDERGSLVPKDGEKYLPEWRHNLGQGALPELVKSTELQGELAALAARCMVALSLDFASVDIIDDGKGLRVLEINSGVMTDSFSSFSDEYYRLASNALRAAVNKYFER